MGAELTLDATIETFDAPAFQAQVASFFGVDAADVTLTVSPASIAVHLVVQFSSAAEAYSAAEQVQFNVSALASAAGVRVESVTVPSISDIIYESWERPPLQPPSPSPPGGHGIEGLTSAQLAVVSVCAGIIVVVLLACTMVARHRRAAAGGLDTLDLPAVSKVAGARARVSSAAQCSREIRDANSVALRVLRILRKRSNRTAEATGATRKRSRLRAAKVAPEPLGVGDPGSAASSRASSDTH